MSLMTTLKKDQLQYRKDKKAAEASLLTTLIGEAAMVGKNDGNRETSDAEVIAVIKKFVKNGQEIINAADPESIAAQNAQVEIVFLEQYLPKQMTDEELREYIKNVVAWIGATSMKDMGIVMKDLQAHRSGEYDGKSASVIVREVLQGL